MSFMKRQVRFARWFILTDSHGETTNIEAECNLSRNRQESVLNAIFDENNGQAIDRFEFPELCASFANYTYSGKVESVDTKLAWGARLSAPGYLDCTDWVLFETKEEAESHLAETYPEDDE